MHAMMPRFHCAAAAVQERLDDDDGVWDGKQLYVGSNFRSWKILANGPVRTVFELSYDFGVALIVPDASGFSTPQIALSLRRPCTACTVH